MRTHSPVTQLNAIEQALSQNRKQIGFFIGAGCPQSIRVNGNPLSPDVSGLTQIIAKELSSNDGKKPSDWDKIVQIAKEDGNQSENIEHLLSLIRSLQNVAGKGVVRGMRKADLEKLNRRICEIISSSVSSSLPNVGTPYHDLAIWARSVQRDKPIHLFTTNYDLLLEQALEESSAPYFDGFIGSRKAFFDLGAVENESLLPSRWIRLWKIHGSLNWVVDDKKNVIRSEQVAPGQSYLIYPSHLKYDQSRKMPYLAMLDRLKQFLLAPASILFLSGYSFGDEHINDIICRSLEANPSAQVFAFLFGGLDQYTEAKRCASSNPNLSLLACDKAVIGRIDGKWLSSETELQSHFPEGIIRRPDEGDSQLMLGDFAMLGKLLKNLSGGTEKDEQPQ